MKMLMASTAIVAATTLGAFAQTADTNSAGQRAPSATQTAPAVTPTAPAATAGSSEMNPSTGFLTSADPSEIQASNFIGMNVYSTGGAEPGSDVKGVPEGWKDIGSIGDLVLSRDGKIDAVVVNIGGFLGIGDHTVALDMSQLKFVSNSNTQDPNDFLIAVNQTKEALKAAPEYKTPNQQRQAQQSSATGSGATTMTGTAAGGAAAPAATGTAANDTGMAPAGTATGATTMTGTATAQNQTPSAEGYQPVQSGQFSAKKLQDAAVYSQQNNTKIGAVSKLVLDSQGQLQQAVVDVGGFLGMGSKPVALSPDQMKIMQKKNGNDIRVYVAMTKDQLKALPTYNG